MAHSGRVLCLLGDIAACHDFSSLLGELPGNLKILILNNQRGGLFARLPVHQYRDELEEVIETPHALEFSTLCGAWPTWAKATNSISSFLNGPGGRFWEFMIDHQQDMREWRELI